MISLAWLTLVGVVVAAALATDWAPPLTIAGVGGWIGVGLAWVLYAGLPGALRAAGRPRLAATAVAAAAMAVVGAAASFTLLPNIPVADLPVLPTACAVTASAWLLTILRNGLEKRTTSRPRPKPTVDDESASAKLLGILVGRFDLPPARARSLMDECRSSDPAAYEAQLRGRAGSLDSLARRLAATETSRQEPRWRDERTQAAIRLAFPVMLAPAIVNFWIDDEDLVAMVMAIAALAAAWDGWRALRRQRDKPGTPGARPGE